MLLLGPALSLLTTGRGKKPKQKTFASGVSEHNLLKFGRVGGLRSDDSDDSDYEPEDELQNTSLL